MEKVCKICGQTVEIKTNSNVCDECKIGTCVQCGNTFRRSSPFTSKFCSVKCKSEYFKKTGLAQIYGQKAKETKIKEYGTTSVYGSTKTRKCKLCGEEFVPKTSNQKYCEKNHYYSCSMCGKQILIDVRNIDTDRCCSDECAAKKRKQTNLERYDSEYVTGSQYFKDKSAETLQEKYGVVNVMQLDEVKEKTRQTWLDRYGVDHPNKSSEVLEKTKKTNLARYGTEWNIQSKEVQDKMKSTLVERYGTKNPMELDSYKNRMHQAFVDKYGVENPMSVKEIRDKAVETCIERYGVPYYIIRDPKFKEQRTSKLNVAFGQKLIESGIQNESEFKLGNRIYDFHILNTNILIEIDPTITHNSYFSIFDSDSNGLDPLYHYNKMNLARKHGYKCINIFDWDNKEEIVENLFSSKEIICDSEIVYCDLSKSDGQEYLDLEMKLVETVPPVKVWSKGCEHIFDKDVQDSQKLLEERWLPVFNCGYEVYHK